MIVQWQGKPGWRNKGHEIEYGVAPHPTKGEYYFSLCGHRHDDPVFRVFVYCHKGWRHIDSASEGGAFASADEAKAFVETWADDTEPTP